VSKDLGKKDGGADSASYKKQMQQVLGPKSQKGKELASFGGGGGSDEEEDGLLEAIKHVNMHITFPVAGEIPMPILAVDMVDFNYVKEEEEEACLALSHFPHMAHSHSPYITRFSFLI
jgi:hypothetical protein|tara:strand:- start:180 stop:533 length:354 start_codon:yes stop_codon:yes gene_type:complete